MFSLTELQNIKNLCSDDVDVASLQNLKTTSVELLRAVTSEGAKLDQIHIKGMLIAEDKAEKFGCLVEVYPNICSTEIVHEERPPRLLIRKDIPPPQRKSVPLYEDVKFLSALFDRNVFLQDLNNAKETATRLSKPFKLLTVNDYPCDYFYEGFFETPSQPSYDHREELFKKSLQKLKIPSNCRELVTIWAENSKALIRYAGRGFDKITVCYPSDMSSREHKRFKGYALESYPNVDIRKVVVSSTADLMQLSADEFREKYNISSRSYFIINYLPQFLHLRYGYCGFSCIYSDSDVIAKSKVSRIPSINLPYEARLDFYSQWISDNYPDIVLAGHGGVYDPVRRLRLSYSQHGCFEDSIGDVTQFGEYDYINQPLSVFSDSDCVSTLKICCNSSMKGYDVLIDTNYLERNYDSDYRCLSLEDSEKVTGEYCIQEKNSSRDVSWIPTDSYLLYVPKMVVFECETDDDGNLNYNDVVISGLPSARVVYVTELNDGTVRICDIKYANKSFFSRRDFIPYHYRVHYSPIQCWNHSYVVFSGSSAPVHSYCVDINKRVSDVLNPDFKSYSFGELIIPGIAWNSVSEMVVYDPDCYMYAGKFNFEYVKHSRVRYYEFKSQYSLARSDRFQVADYYIELPGSRSLDVVPPDYLQKLFEDNIPAEYLPGIMKRYALSYVNGSDRKTFSEHCNTDLEDVSFSNYDLWDVANRERLRAVESFGLACDQSVILPDGVEISYLSLMPMLDGNFLVLDGDLAGRRYPYVFK